MLEPLPWTDRPFAFDLPLGAAPALVERLRGTPVRLAERLGGASEAARITRPPAGWSAQEHGGHLLDLEPLWDARVSQLLLGVETLAPADMTNARTHDARHNAKPLPAILDPFAAARGALVARLEALAAADWARTAWHARLGRALRLLDLAVLVADHDDHHLAAITRCLAARR